MLTGSPGCFLAIIFPMEAIVEILVYVIVMPSVQMVSRIFPGKKGSRKVKVACSIASMVLLFVFFGLLAAGLVLMTTDWWDLGVILLSVGASLLFAQLVVGAIFAYRNIGKDDPIEF